MNAKQLAKLGVPPCCVKVAICCIQKAAKDKMPKNTIKDVIEGVVKDPENYKTTELFGELAQAMIEYKSFVPKEPITYKTWGNDIDPGAHMQMQNACKIPCSVAGALMPDTHVGYGLPCGGVLALDNAVSPFCVGADISCMMSMSIFNIQPETIDKHHNLFVEALEKGTNFGVGCEYKPRKSHPVMDEDWNITKVTNQNKDKAWNQLGTSGSSNHFADIGKLTILNSFEMNGVKLESGQTFVALMCHGGSRGTGMTVCDHYSNLAQALLPYHYKHMGKLAWLDLNTESGQEYWLAMNLMGRYASANHDIIHHEIAKLIKEPVYAHSRNFHNFAWKESYQGKEVIVHRKGATPAGKDVLGIIPGSMGSPAYLVLGLGNEDSLCSASHGAGRKMSRKKAKEMYSWNAVKNDLLKKGIDVLSSGADEVPQAYKDINDVIAAQSDLVKVVARFDPRIVKMSDDGKHED